jgi:hypothetical protein
MGHDRLTLSIIQQFMYDVRRQPDRNMLFDYLEL